MLRQRWLMVVMGLATGTTAAGAQAQFHLEVAAPVEGGQAGVFVGRAEGPPVGTAGPGTPGQLLFVEALDSGRAVEGAPYSAEAVTETTQVLADGNRINHRSSARVTRDGRGRERREHEGMSVGALAAQPRAALVTIMDPVSGTAVTLDEERRVATRLRLRGVHVATAGVNQGVVTTTASASRGGEPVATFQWSAAAVAPAAATTMMAIPAAAGGPAHVEALGTQVIEGVMAEGVRNTVTIPAGAIGNDLPIATVYERWYSPELQTVVMSRRSDPRFGETVFRLVGIVRAEPPPDLFTVPTDYRIEEPHTAVRPQ